MTILQTIHHKKNEIQAEEFYKDEECTEDFDFTNAKNLYIEFVNGDVTPLFYTQYKISSRSKIFSAYIPSHLHSIVSDFAIENKITVCTFDYASQYDSGLSQITPNLSKYIPEDNAVLFLSEQDMEKYKVCFPNNHIGLYTNDGSNDETFIANNLESLIDGIVEVKKGNTTIFLPHGTQSEILKAEEVGKYLWENFGIKPNLCVLHCFVKFENLSFGAVKLSISKEYDIDNFNFNKIITTNSTGILKPENSTERLQVIDAKEIFEEYLNENNLI